MVLASAFFELKKFTKDSNKKRSIESILLESDLKFSSNKFRRRDSLFAFLFQLNQLNMIVYTFHFVNCN